jgi:hypothetical protein
LTSHSTSHKLATDRAAAATAAEMLHARLEGATGAGAMEAVRFIALDDL